MPAPIVDAPFADCIALPPPLPLLTSCRESLSAPRHFHAVAPSVSYCTPPDHPETDDGDAAENVPQLTSPAATYKEQGREISGLVRAFSRTSVDSTSGQRSSAGKILPRHTSLMPSKSSPALHRSSSKSSTILPVHKEESTDVSLQHEDKHYSPSDCTTLLSSSADSTSTSELASSSSSPYLSCAILTPSSHRSLSAHVPFRTQVARQRSLPTTHTGGPRRRRVTASRKDDKADGRTASTASTCSMASTSLSNLTSPSFTDNHTLFFNPDSADNNDADLDSDSDASEKDEDDDNRRRRHRPSHSPPTHFTFSATLALQASASFSHSHSSPAGACFSPLSPLFDSSLSNGRHSADAQFSAGIGVFAGQLQALRRMRSANATIPSANEHKSPSHSCGSQQ